ncbi:glycosyltransferase [Sulfitobacter albidus]|uniref:Glycosyltransferase n=1 Tax=Sulfitobacter albidus TaxID=2829501 RepID=A0A975JDC5_9RHOB|nr:glycosyltransferase [Sulfitobacter albidus]QUJ76005.1 glycosyltransferase [Sulfitobacter albidus]
MSRPLRVLYYNWVDYLDAEGRGGGVTLYQRNVMNALAGDASVEATFVSAGLSYDVPARAPRWEPVRHGPRADRDRRYEIVNSGVLAHSHLSFGDPAQVSHPATRDVFFDFVARTGPYDVIHFNNLEGLPADVLSVKQRHPETKIVFALHNYYPICPQVNLWYAERETCEDFEGGARCVGCLTHQHDARVMRIANGVSYRLRCAGLEPGTRTYDGAFRAIIWSGGRLLRAKRWLGGQRRDVAKPPVLSAEQARASAASFAARRREMIALINENCDHVLCVSDAVRVLAENYGIAPLLTTTSYIGTQAAEMFAQTQPDDTALGKPTLTLGYLGYMRRDKGFYFLLDALEALPPQIATRLRIVIAARTVDRATLARVMRLGDHLAEVVHHDGYTHNDLDTILAPVDVGVVPVLWHDNLPQVAIEMHARHIPLLTSDMGGAQELGGDTQMIFTAGDPADFERAIARLLQGDVDTASYWHGAMPPVTMPAHVDQLLDLYRSD